MLPQRFDPIFPFRRRQLASDGGHFHLFGQGVAQRFSHVFSGGDETAEQDRIVAVFQQFLDQRNCSFQLQIRFWSLQLLGLACVT